MIQFNLLPAVKVEHIRTQKIKRLVMGVAIVSIAFSVVMLLILFSYAAVQKEHISNLDTDISRIQGELESNGELKTILSVQSQLNSLPALYDGRPAAERLPDFIDQTTPADVGLGKLSLDFSLSTLELGGSASSLQAVNAYVDTLKAVTFVSEEGAQPESAFTGVVLTQFGRDDSEASFTINLSFNPLIFDATREVTLKVPNGVTTRAQTNPADLFDGSATEDDNAE